MGDKRKFDNRPEWKPCGVHRTTPFQISPPPYPKPAPKPPLTQEQINALVSRLYPRSNTSKA